jgi:hypothetical protein
MNQLQLLREYIELLMIMEAPVPLRKPKTSEQRAAFIKLLKWAAEKMKVPPKMLNSAVDSALDEDNWDEAIELVRDFYVMKQIEFKAA